ncbi:MAG: hypothetical protein AAF902_11830 [Chloroflexota bacterium]
MDHLPSDNKRGELTDSERAAYLFDLTFSVQNISPACGSLFPNAVDRAKEAEFLSWMQDTQSMSRKQDEA